ncbi:hypothetical protein [Streptomyces sp. 8L]|uniref:hypothetical protein n=1 Tax=Streptomyces sp. 8L TaxID=2877242 RepID=UPI001CD7E654|nr:hypothetical protein [Streptomyces sp. 8L]MCA1222082.1 hypothetical protein [Streptomyces sp. 8L]
MIVSRPTNRGVLDGRNQAPATVDRVWHRSSLSERFRCEAFATLESPGPQSAIIRSMFWLSRDSVSGPDAAVAWFVARLEPFARFLSGPDVSRATRWTGDEETRRRALLTLRAGRRLSVEIVDCDHVHYQAVVCPVRERPRSASAPPSRTNTPAPSDAKSIAEDERANERRGRGARQYRRIGRPGQGGPRPGLPGRGA